MTGIPTYISTNTTTQVFVGKGVLNVIVVGTTAAGSIIVYDSATTTANKVLELKSSIVEGSYIFNIRLKNGCRIVTAASSLITVVTS